MSQFFRPLIFSSLPIFFISFSISFSFLHFFSCFFFWKLWEQSCNGYNNWSMARETDVARSSLTYLYARDTVQHERNQQERKSGIVLARTDDIFLGWNFSLETVDQFFSNPMRPHHSVRWTERYSLDGEAKAYIEANGAILGDSSPPRHVFPSYTAFPFFYRFPRRILI